MREYEHALNEVAARLHASSRKECESFTDWSQRIYRLARHRDRKLYRWLRKEFSAYVDRSQDPSNFV